VDPEFFYLVKIPAEMANTNLASQSYISYGIGTLGLLAGLLLWAFPVFIANKIVPRGGFDTPVNLNAFDVARVGCSLLGLWFFANALPAMLWFVFVGMGNAESGQSVFQSLQSEEKIKLGYYLAQLLLSFLLIFKAHLFANLRRGMWKLRMSTGSH
jgi:hypothetical protein